MEKSFWMATVRFLIVALSIIGIIVSFFLIFPLIYPFLIGFLLALMYNPVVQYLSDKAKLPRWLSVTLTIFFILTILTALIVVAVLVIQSEIQTLQQTLPKHIEHYMILIQEFIMNNLVPLYDQISFFYSALDPEVRGQLEIQISQFMQGMSEFGATATTHFLDGVMAVIRFIPAFAVAFLISLLASFFFSKDWPKWRKKCVDLIPVKVQQSGGAVFAHLRYAIFGYIKAQFILISITFMIVLIGLLVLRVEYALTISLFVGLVELIPYLGTGLILIPWIIYLFIIGDYGMVIGLSILYGLVLLQRQIMEPKILGDNVGLDPLVTLFSLFVGYQLFGLVGFIIGPVLMVMIGSLHRAGVFTDLWGFIKGT